MMSLREEANYIVEKAIHAVSPDEAVGKALEKIQLGSGNVYLVAAGKAAYQMAEAASKILGKRMSQGVCISKYGHIKGPLDRVKCYEAGHPVPDKQSFIATEAALQLVSGLQPEDDVLFLLSGGGSALFEKPLIRTEALEDITKQLLACGADIVEMNTLRKRFSAVKGGRFAKLCEPAHVHSILLSDIVGNPLDMIASGPAYPDSTTSYMAREVVRKYELRLTPPMERLLSIETPKVLNNVTTYITGSVKDLCQATQVACESLGYQTVLLTDALNSEAKEAGSLLASIAKTYQGSSKSLAFIAGGETVVRLTGKGKGGRNQELALSAARGISGLRDTVIFSVGSDGTDGPTDAAGGYVNGYTESMLKTRGIQIFDVLRDNDAYHALKETGGLIMTGPTGTNVNDVSVLLIRR